MDWKTSFMAFLCVVAGACVIPFVSIDDGKIEPDKVEPVKVVAAPENTTTNLFTNALERVNQPNTGWFIDSSNYIWDGWKIK